MRERRHGDRRHAEQLIVETLRFHQTIIDLLKGKKGNLGDALCLIQWLGCKLGRRGRDLRIGREYAITIEAVAEVLVELGLIERLPRKIRIRKIDGNGASVFPIGTEITGWEIKPPCQREKYFVYLDDGRIYRTSSVRRCAPKQFHTCNSVYALEILEEPYMGTKTWRGKSRPIGQ